MPEEPRRAAAGNFWRHFRPGSFRPPASRRRGRRPVSSWPACAGFRPGSRLLRAAPQVTRASGWRWCAWRQPTTRLRSRCRRGRRRSRPSYTVPPSNACARSISAGKQRAAGAAARCRRLCRPARLASLAVAVRSGAPRVAQRPGFPIDVGLSAGGTGRVLSRTLLHASPAALAESPAGRIVTFAMTQLAISATQIRGLLAKAAVPAICCLTKSSLIFRKHLYPEY
jgi:hypothetical protein